MTRYDNMTSWTIREARSAEAPRLAMVGERLFRQGYGDTHPEPALSEYVAESFSIERCRRILADPACLVLVVEAANGAWSGYAQLKEGSPDPSLVRIESALPGERPIEIVRFYVDEAWHGRGLAQALMSACNDAAHVRQGDVLWLQAWQEAARPLAFYRKAGFDVFGTASFLFAGVQEADVLLARRVRQSAVTEHARAE